MWNTQRTTRNDIQACKSQIGHLRCECKGKLMSLGWVTVPVISKVFQCTHFWKNQYATDSKNITDI